jgi:hypothetical protein
MKIKKNNKIKDFKIIILTFKKKFYWVPLKTEFRLLGAPILFTKDTKIPLYLLLF